MLSVGPSVDFFLSLILLKPQHLIFIFCWNFHRQLKSNLGPALERCANHTASLLCFLTIRKGKGTVQPLSPCVTKALGLNK